MEQICFKHYGSFGNMNSFNPPTHQPPLPAEFGICQNQRPEEPVLMPPNDEATIRWKFC